MSNLNTLSELRELREVLGRASALVLGLRQLRNFDGLADIDPDFQLGEAIGDRPELHEGLIQHFDKQSRWIELEDRAEGLLADAAVRLDGCLLYTSPSPRD